MIRFGAVADALAAPTQPISAPSNNPLDQTHGENISACGSPPSSAVRSACYAHRWRSLIVGLAMMRYVRQVGALAVISADQVVAVIAPTVQRYLDGKIPGCRRRDPR